MFCCFLLSSYTSNVFYLSEFSGMHFTTMGNLLTREDAPQYNVGSTYFCP
jgi:hypothetical protein